MVTHLLRKHCKLRDFQSVSDNVKTYLTSVVTLSRVHWTCASCTLSFRFVARKYMYSWLPKHSSLRVLSSNPHQDIESRSMDLSFSSSRPSGSATIFFCLPLSLLGISSCASPATGTPTSTLGDSSVNHSQLLSYP